MLCCQDAWRDECLRRGGIPLVVRTDSDPAVELTKFFTAWEHK